MDSETGFLATDWFEYGVWFKVNLVSSTHFLAATANIEKAREVVAAIELGVDPVAILRSCSPIDQPPAIIRLEEITGLELPAETRLTVHYAKDHNSRDRTTSANYSTTEARDEAAKAVAEALGTFRRVEEAVGVWALGLEPLFLCLLPLLLAGVGIAGLLDPQAFAVGNQGDGRGQTVALVAGLLINLVGSVPLLLISIAIFTGLMAWWYARVRNPPLKTVFRRAE